MIWRMQRLWLNFMSVENVLEYGKYCGLLKLRIIAQYTPQKRMKMDENIPKIDEDEYIVEMCSWVGVAVVKISQLSTGVPSPGASEAALD